MRHRALPFTGIVLATVLAFAPVGQAAPVNLVDEAPIAITTVAPGVHLVDFGRVAFGNLRLTPPTGAGRRPGLVEAPTLRRTHAGDERQF